jgi:hypothetical protein
MTACPHDADGIAYWGRWRSCQVEVPVHCVAERRRRRVTASLASAVTRIPGPANGMTATAASVWGAAFADIARLA